MNGVWPWRDLHLQKATPFYEHFSSKVTTEVPGKKSPSSQTASDFFPSAVPTIRSAADASSAQVILFPGKEFPENQKDQQKPEKQWSSTRYDVRNNTIWSQSCVKAVILKPTVSVYTTLK